jgi:hypothetical protein
MEEFFFMQLVVWGEKIRKLCINVQYLQWYEKINPFSHNKCGTNHFPSFFVVQCIWGHLGVSLVDMK